MPVSSRSVAPAEAEARSHSERHPGERRGPFVSEHGFRRASQEIPGLSPLARPDAVAHATVRVPLPLGGPVSRGASPRRVSQGIPGLSPLARPDAVAHATVRVPLPPGCPFPRGASPRRKRRSVPTRSVTPANAGVHFHSGTDSGRESGNLGLLRVPLPLGCPVSHGTSPRKRRSVPTLRWIPACAGMTALGCLKPGPWLRSPGN
jgi:hypothetical protein